MSIVRTRGALELQHYWRTMKEGLAGQTLAEFQSELMVLGLMTSSPALRAACEKGARRFDHIGRIVVANSR